MITYSKRKISFPVAAADEAAAIKLVVYGRNVFKLKRSYSLEKVTMGEKKKVIKVTKDSKVVPNKPIKVRNKAWRLIQQRGQKKKERAEGVGLLQVYKCSFV